MELLGKIIHVGDIRQISETFSVRDFVIEVTDQGRNGQTFVNKIKFQLKNGNCYRLHEGMYNTHVKVQFSIEGREWEGNGKKDWFNTLNAYRIDSMTQSTQPQYQQPTLQQPQQNQNFNQNAGDDLPF